MFHDVLWISLVDSLKFMVCSDWHTEKYIGTGARELLTAHHKR